MEFFCLFQELLSRTNLETHKLDLMAEISALKLKLATSEKARCEFEQKVSEGQVSTSGICQLVCWNLKIVLCKLNLQKLMCDRGP